MTVGLDQKGVAAHSASIFNGRQMRCFQVLYGLVRLLGMSDTTPERLDPLAIYAFCPVITALEMIGERWVILILRDLLRNPSRRFQDLQDSLKGCAPSTLSTRLKALEANGLIERRLYEQHPPRLEYLLTTKGREVGPVVASLRDWGLRLQEQDPPR